MKMTPRPSRQRGRLWLLSPFAGRLLALGHILLFLSVACFVAMYHSPVRAETLLYAETYFGSVGGSAAVLWGVVLGVDWLERKER